MEGKIDWGLVLLLSPFVACIVMCVVSCVVQLRMFDERDKAYDRMWANWKK